MLVDSCYPTLKRLLKRLLKDQEFGASLGYIADHSRMEAWKDKENEFLKDISELEKKELYICVAVFFITGTESLTDPLTGEKIHFDPQSQRVSVLQGWLGMVAEARPIWADQEGMTKTQARLKLSKTLQDPLTSTKEASHLKCSTVLQKIAVVWETGLQNRSLVGREHFKHKP